MYSGDNVSCSSGTVPWSSVISWYTEVTNLSLSPDEFYTLETRLDWHLWSDCCCFVAGEVPRPYTGQVAVQRRCKVLPRATYFVDNVLPVGPLIVNIWVFLSFFFFFLQDCSHGSWQDGSSLRFLPANTTDGSRVVPRFLLGALHFEEPAST
jgi:hypothetical protein